MYGRLDVQRTCIVYNIKWISKIFFCLPNWLKLNVNLNFTLSATHILLNSFAIFIVFSSIQRKKTVATAYACIYIQLNGFAADDYIHWIITLSYREFVKEKKNIKTILQRNWEAVTWIFLLRQIKIVADSNY